MTEYDRYRSVNAFVDRNPTDSEPMTVRLFEPSGGGHWDEYQWNFGFSINPPTYIRLFGDDIHALGYTRGFKEGSRRFPVGACFNDKIDFLNIPLLPNFTWGDGHIWQIIVNRPSLPFNQAWFGQLWDNLGSIYYPTQAMMPRIPSNVRDNLCEEAFNYFATVFPQTLSFGEFVQGMAELKALLPEIGDSIAKTISGGYLNKSFGWDNLLADLGTLGSMFRTTIERMEYLHRTYGIPQRLGFSRSNVYEPSLVSYDYNYSEGYPGFGSRIYLDSYQVNFRATAWITQALDYVEGLAGFMRVLFGQLGLNNPVRAFWQTVPLSFVVDWFFQISKHLENLTTAQPAVGWDVNDVTHSVTYKAEWKIEPYGVPGYGVVFDSMPQGVIKRDLYERAIGLSFDLDVLQPDDLSPAQQTLLLAMLHQLG
jgi:hypothetical protein